MPNHVHLVVVPSSPDGLQRPLQAVHSQYAQRVNRMKARVGHLWQGRYHSYPLDAEHFLNSIRYVELNPVAAGIVNRAEDYPWSSAAAHCGLRNDFLIEPPDRSTYLRGLGDWSTWLGRGVPDACRERLKRHELKNLPCGSDAFVAKLENRAGRDLKCRPRGGQRKRPL
jgi:putative transposase